jgi:tetratricopeptide (TPR) repeat protein
MSLIQIDLVGWLPDSLKQQVIDSVVTFVAEQAEKAGRDDVSQALKRLRSDAAFQDAVDRGLKEATDRFVREYMVKDEDLVAAIARDPDFWKAESVREALLEIVRHPGVYLAEERMALAQSFADVLSQRVNRERVDRAVTFYLRCVAESLWHLEPLRPMYELQMQRLSVERATEMVQELRGMRADVQGAMMALVQAIGEQQKRLPAPDRSALPEPKKVYHNLPQPDYGTFIGREKELAQVHRILRPYPHSQEHLVTIDGIGGIGKSALTLEVAHRYLRDYDRLPPEERFDAIIWTSAKAEVLTANGIAPRQQITRTLDDIYTTIAVTLEREDIARARPQEQDELVTKALTQQRALLIVDNLETVDDERVNAFLRELPAPTKAVVTTRHRIDVAYPVRLTGMPKEDGLALIAQECAKKGVTLTEAEAEKLYDRTGGVPLAIVWSIAQIGYGYSVEDVLRRLGQPTEDIARFCFEGAMERIRDADAYKLLMALSLFATDASREALGHVAGLGNDVLSRDEGLVMLEKLSLVNRVAGRGNLRFKMLPLTREFAIQKLRTEPSSEQEYIDRWIEYLTELAVASGGRFWHWKDAETILLEGDNLLGALDWSIANKQDSMTFKIAKPVLFYLENEGRWTSEVDYADEVLRRALEAANIDLAAWLCSHILGWICRQQSNYQKAENHLKQALEYYDQLGNAEGKCLAMRTRGAVLRKQGRFEEARQIYQEALRLATDSQFGEGIASITHEMAKLALNEGQIEKARQLSEKAQYWADRSETDLGVYPYISLTNAVLRARIAFECADYVGTVQILEAALNVLGKWAGPGYTSNVKLWLALAKERLGEFEEAFQLVSEAYPRLKTLGIIEDVNLAKQLLARLEKSRGKETPPSAAEC